MSILQTIHDRRSIGKLHAPMPSDEELTLAIKTAMTAPDHKQLKPWQFVVLTGDALDEFGQKLLQAGEQLAKDKGETLDDTARTKFANMPKRAPMIITVSTDIKEHEKVPPFEQLLSTGAMIQTLLIALKSMGYDSVWRTGELTNHNVIKTYFKVAQKDTICGFVYVGSSDVVMPSRDEVALDDFVTFY